MIFYKFDSYGDIGIATSLVPTNNDQLQLKRIMLTQKRSFAGINDNNELYFCGYTDNNNGDIIIGSVTSTDLAAITITETF